MKSEPDTYSIADLRRDGRTQWEGVRNYQARNFLRAMRRGDLALFYHSSVVPPVVAGLMRIVREAAPDPAQFDPGSGYHDPASTRAAPRWWQVEVAFVEAFATPVPLPRLKADPALRGMLLFTRGRLSVLPVSRAHFDRIVSLARRPGRTTGRSLPRRAAPGSGSA
jgi:predicted RNA-binding protein with PUA-like domain